MKTFEKFRADLNTVLEQLEPSHDLSVLEFAAFTKNEEIEEDEGAPTNNMGSGNIPGANIPAGSNFGEPGVPVRKKLEIVNGPPVDPRLFADKIFDRKPPIKATVEGTMASVVTQPWHASNSPEDLEQIYDLAAKKAEANKSRFESILKRASHGQAKILVGIKTRESFLDKTIQRGKSADQVYDVLRGAILTDTQDEAADVIQNLKRTQIFMELEFKDKGTDPKFGYYGSYHIRLVVNDLICEVQVMTKRLWTYKKWAHEFYTQFRSAKEEPSIDTLRQSKHVFTLGNMNPYRPNKKKDAKNDIN